MCLNEQCRHPYTCGCESCEPSPRQRSEAVREIPVYKPCQCEHSTHGDSGCQMVRQREAKTIHGTFHLCLTCLERGHMGIGLVRVDTPLPEGFEGF